MRLPGLRWIPIRIRNAGSFALLAIVLVFSLYFVPYVVDAARCVDSMEQPAAQREDARRKHAASGRSEHPATQREERTVLSFWQCLGETYDRARQDTNLAAIIIAMAVILAAWRPGQDGS